MNSKVIILTVIIFIGSSVIAQNKDSFKIVLANSKEDTNKVNIYFQLAWTNQWSYPDTAIMFAMEGLKLARKLSFRKGEMSILSSMGEALSSKGNYSKALEVKLQCLELAEASGNPQYLGTALSGVGTVYFYSGDYASALKYFLRASGYISRYEIPLAAFIGEAYYHVNQLDSSLHYITKADELRQRRKWPIPDYYLGHIYTKKNNLSKALEYYRRGFSLASEKLDIVDGHVYMATIFKTLGQTDSAIYYAKNILGDEFTSFPSKQIEAGRLLAEIYKPINIDSAFKYQEIMLAANDNLFSKEKIRQMQNLAFNEQMRQKEIFAEQMAYKNKMKTYGLAGVGAIFLIIALMLWRNNRYRQKAFRLLQFQKSETDQQKAKAEKTLEELRATQAQLIQSEKMASLGELTAGIAHEIQNPLNFVNNFSDVNKELIEELKEQLATGNGQEAIMIADDIKENEQKINHHGKRADAIVKGMLQHSRASNGKKELTDINALADEYLRLSYHGLRAKDKSFNAAFKTDFDDSIGKLEVVPQDIGRVLLNLYNNAFYSVNEKKKQLNGIFQPTVEVSTKRSLSLPTGQAGFGEPVPNNREGQGEVIISVKDNGNGIRQKIIDKIYQPFFTTKPTGEGTGLGLSISYDIMKAHGGEIKVETKEGEWTEFIIYLPITS